MFQVSFGLEYPSDRNMWAHMLTIPRELSIEDNRLVQKPLSDLQALRAGSQSLTAEIKLENPAFEIEFDTELECFSIVLSNQQGAY